MTLLTDQLVARIGSVVEYTAPEPFGQSAGRYFASAIGDQNPIYRDASVAAALGLPALPLPPTLVCETNQFTGLPMAEDGNTGHDWGLDVPGTRQVRGGNRYRFHRRVYPDDMVTARFTLAGIEPKTTRAGAEMLVFTTTVEYFDQRGELLVENEETLVLVSLEPQS